MCDFFVTFQTVCCKGIQSNEETCVLVPSPFCLQKKRNVHYIPQMGRSQNDHNNKHNTSEKRKKIERKNRVESCPLVSAKSKVYGALHTKEEGKRVKVEEKKSPAKVLGKILILHAVAQKRVKLRGKKEEFENFPWSLGKQCLISSLVGSLEGKVKGRKQRERGREGENRRRKRRTSPAVTAIVLYWLSGLQS